MRALALFCLLAGCAETRNAPDVLAAHGQQERRIAASTSAAPRPWAVGQWTLYKFNDGQHVGYSKHAVVATGTCGTWIESTYVDDRWDDRFIIKTCFDKPTAGVLIDPDSMQATMVRQHDRTLVMDFRNGQNPHTKQLMKNNYARFVTLAWQSAPATEQAEITVPAGHFGGAHKIVTRLRVEQSLHGVEVWTHPDVPLGGTIKLSADNGAQSVLLDYGLSGAKGELPDFDQHLADSAAQ